MKLLWLVLLALSALLMQITKAESVQNKYGQENKLVNEVVKQDRVLLVDDNKEGDNDRSDGVNDVATNQSLAEEESIQETIPKKDLEALTNQADQYSKNSTQELIAEEDVAAFEEQPGLQRLARRLRSFHNANILAGNNNQLQQRTQNFTAHDEEDEFLAKERAIRQRQHLRSRKIKNKNKLVKPNTANMGKRRKSNNKNSLRRKLPQKFNKGKKNKNNYRIKKTNIRRGTSTRKGINKKNYRYRNQVSNTKSGQRRQRVGKRRIHNSNNKSRQTDDKERIFWLEMPEAEDSQIFKAS